MFKKIVPITLNNHKDLKVKQIDNFNFVSDIHLASVMVHEFSRAAATYPIVFLEDKANDKFRPVVMLGLEAGENLFVQEGKWKASYIPAIVRRYPFALSKTGDEDRYVICIDEDSEFVNNDEGQAIFKEDGTADEVMDRVKKYLTELQQMDLFTDKFCEDMKSENMFTPLNMKVRVGDEIKNVGGAYVINEERFNDLNNEKFVELREKKYIPVIYSHLSSLAQIERLLTFKDTSRAVTEKIEERFEEVK
ncbi:SapC family protein [Arcobacter roscoffensis]|uniref:SapC family protein n=1 Tax=Arcobacter roscoffensis TaxID=2961520 RepID=A0ABY5E7U8_9BACT|nr:SapC family protein [Arcobacter roscoffensis]UTJ07599.1 SapC family protein [Arcobacter roscoffensis]